MNRFLFIFATLTFYFQLFAFNCFAQTPDWQWAKSIYGNGGEYGNCIATDADDNIVTAGLFTSDTITIGAIKLANRSPGSSDIFIAKYDAQGNVLWARSAGGMNEDLCNSIAIGDHNDIVMTGYFSSPYIVFGVDTLFNSGSQDILFAKYDTQGNLLWAKSTGGLNDEEGSGITFDSDNNILMTGNFYSQYLVFGTDTIFNSGGWNPFVVKLSSSGNIIWTASAHCGNALSEGITTDAVNNVIILGSYNVRIIFGTDTLNSLNYNSQGISDIFVAKYTSSGNVLWASTSSNTNPLGLSCPGADNFGKSIITDNSNNIYIAGEFMSHTIRFGIYTFVNHDYPLQCPYNDIYIVKYDASGNVLWAKAAGSWDKECGMGITTDSNNNVIVAGYYGDNMTFGYDTLYNIHTGDENIFIVKYDSLGNFKWDKSAGYGSIGRASSIAVDHDDNIIISGRYDGPPFSFGNIILASTASTDAFVAKISETTGIDEQITKDKNISLFPNPSSNFITIKTPAYGGYGEFIIINIKGQQVIKQEFNNTNTAINISDLARGIYFIKVINKNGIAVKKFVKE
jgi:hypothetical protein